jgi:hypothetical protein
MLPSDVVQAGVVLSWTITILCPLPYPLLVLDLTILPAAPFALITSLPLWQSSSSLLNHLDPIQNVHPLKALLESRETLKLYLVSIGGTKEDIGSFGWEQLTIGQLVLWRCKGPTFSLNPFMRANSYGLAALHHDLS